jgi:hypothetical protein
MHRVGYYTHNSWCTVNPTSNTMGGSTYSKKIFNLETSANTGRFITSSVITNIYNKKTEGPTLMELFTATGKLIFFYNYTCSMCVLRVTRCTHIDACVARSWISYRCVPCHPWCTHRIPLVIKNNFFSFPVAVKNSIKVRPLDLLL